MLLNSLKNHQQLFTYMSLINTIDEMHLSSTMMVVTQAWQKLHLQSQGINITLWD